MLTRVIGLTLTVAFGLASLASCSDDDEPEASSSTSTTAAPTTSTTGAGATTTTGDITSPQDPAVGEVLPDGRHFGYLLRLQEMDDGVEHGTFDLAYLYTGAAAVAAAEEDGEADLEIDYYIRNENDRTRSVELAPDVAITVVGGSHPCCESYPATLGELYEHLASEPDEADREGVPVHLTIAEGKVTRIDEQYFP